MYSTEPATSSIAARPRTGMTLKPRPVWASADGAAEVSVGETNDSFGDGILDVLTPLFPSDGLLVAVCDAETVEVDVLVELDELLVPPDAGFTQWLLRIC